ncbi:flavodoxin [Lachnospiraceae bacterium LCP25S3_G4]
MEKIQIVYWSGTGNTETMANMISKGVKEGGAEAVVVPMESMDKEELLEQKGFALGCPSMGAEELEESVVEPFISEIEHRIEGKQIVLFGSYGWGDGEWMRNWVERMEHAGSTVIGGEGIIANEAPDSEIETKCKEIGRLLASL